MVATYDNIYVSFGDGANIAGALGYFLNKRTSFEVSGAYSRSRTYTAYSFSKQYENGTLVAEGSRTKKMYSRTGLFEASVVLSHPLNSRLTPFIKLGGILALPTIYFKENIINNDLCGDVYD